MRAYIEEGDFEPITEILLYRNGYIIDGVITPSRPLSYTYEYDENKQSALTHVIMNKELRFHIINK